MRVLAPYSILLTMQNRPPDSNQNTALRIGIDIGGTFTDFVIFDPKSGKIETYKVASTPDDPSKAVLKGLERLTEPTTNTWNIVHGSTVATNALLERKGAVTALITTRGFRDVLHIRRQDRPDLYDFNTTPVEPLIAAEYRLEVDERVTSLGEVLSALDDSQVDELIAELKAITTSKDSQPTAIESVAVCLLFSFLHPEHEQRIAEKLRVAGFYTSASHEILPEYREYERTSTTVVNAYVSPVLDRYLSKLEQALSPSSNPKSPNSNIQYPTSTLQIMQSNGGSISVAEAKISGVRCILSGPAGGVVGCQYVGERIQRQSPTSSLQLLTFDMGGTSTDVALIDDEPRVTSEAEVGGHPIAIPLLDIHTIGAGGGSIAYIDAGGVLRVGPESAGANPGPACYGKSVDSGESHIPTVTDANVVLGRIPPADFLGGAMPLYPELAEAAITKLGIELGLSAIEAALGIIEIANAHMERALRVISVERGYDPRDFTLLSFGGAGGLHATDLARRLHIPEVLISPYASTFSAFGMLAADVIKDYTQTIMLPGNTPQDDIKARFEPLMQKGANDLANEGIDAQQIHLFPALDMRYRGQSYELSIPFDDEYIAAFHRTHHLSYGYNRPQAEIEIVNLRLRAIGKVPSPDMLPQSIGDHDATNAYIDSKPALFSSGEIEIPFYRGEKLQPRNEIHGPAIVIRNDTTILINSKDHASVDPYLNLKMDIGI